MITDFILHGVFLVVQFLLYPLASLDDAVVSPYITDAIAATGAWLNAVSAALPMNAIYIILGIILVFEFAIFFLKGIIFGIKRIPFVG